MRGWGLQCLAECFMPPSIFRVARFSFGLCSSACLIGSKYQAMGCVCMCVCVLICMLKKLNAEKKSLTWMLECIQFHFSSKLISLTPVESK